MEAAALGRRRPAHAPSYLQDRLPTLEYPGIIFVQGKLHVLSGIPLVLLCDSSSRLQALCHLLEYNLL